MINDFTLIKFSFRKLRIEAAKRGKSWKVFMKVRESWLYLHGVVGQHQVPQEEELVGGEVTGESPHDPPEEGHQHNLHFRSVLNDCESIAGLNWLQCMTSSRAGQGTDLKTTLVGWMSEVSRWIHRSGSCFWSAETSSRLAAFQLATIM